MQCNRAIKFFVCHLKKQNLKLKQKTSESFQVEIHILQEANDITSFYTGFSFCDYYFLRIVANDVKNVFVDVNADAVKLFR